MMKDESIDYLPSVKNLMDMLHMGIKPDHVNKYQAKDSNCKFCRKKCPLFSKNECFKKTVEEQQSCEHFKGVVK